MLPETGAGGRRCTLRPPIVRRVALSPFRIGIISVCAFFSLVEIAGLLTGRETVSNVIIALIIFGAIIAFTMPTSASRKERAVKRAEQQIREQSSRPDLSLHILQTYLQSSESDSDKDIVAALPKITNQVIKRPEYWIQRITEIRASNDREINDIPYATCSRCHSEQTSWNILKQLPNDLQFHSTGVYCEKCLPIEQAEAQEKIDEQHYEIRKLRNELKANDGEV